MNKPFSYSYMFFCRRNFNSQQSKVNLLKVSARSPPHSAASEYIRTPEQQVIQVPRYIINSVFQLCCIALLAIVRVLFSRHKPFNIFLPFLAGIFHAIGFMFQWPNHKVKILCGESWGINFSLGLWDFSELHTSASQNSKPLSQNPTNYRDWIFIITLMPRFCSSIFVT